MSLDRLVAMANDIAAFFSGEAGSAAPEAVASHLRRFWAPRMRAQLVQAVQTNAAETGTLSDTARRAVLLLSTEGSAG